jgi:hypothetical protein
MAHYFWIHNLAAFLTNLKDRRYERVPAPPEGTHREMYAQIHSGALVKYYSYSTVTSAQGGIKIRVSYEVVDHGRVLKKLARELKSLNAQYRDCLPGWKTKSPPEKAICLRRWEATQLFLRKHAELIANFRYPGDDRLTEGNMSFNLLIASTPPEQVICIEFIKALVEAYSPQAIIRGHRQIDLPTRLRNDWIKRFAGIQKRRGWSPHEIVRETQKELREGTWNHRLKIQFNLAPTTISKIAGFKLN